MLLHKVADTAFHIQSDDFTVNHFISIKISLNLMKHLFVDSKLIQYLNKGDLFFFTNKYMLYHLKLGIVLAITVSNECKI